MTYTWVDTGGSPVAGYLDADAVAQCRGSLVITSMEGTAAP
jgi:hypothetical protein